MNIEDELLKLTAGLARFEQHFVQIDEKLDRVMAKQDLTNGRVNSLEAMQEERLIREAREQGLADGRKDALLTRTQVLQLGALASAAAAIMTLVSKALE